MSDDFHIHVNGMLDMDGKEYSKEFLTAAVAFYELARAKVEPEKPYRFQPGDVARTRDGEVRIIVRIDDLHSVSLLGCQMTGSEMGNYGQVHFEEMGYVKIGVLSDFLPKDE